MLTIRQCPLSKGGCPAIPYVKYSTFNIKYDSINDQSSVNEGSTLTYKCLVGRLTGSATLVCRNGQWVTNNLPSCQINYCSTEPPKPLNSYITYKKLVYANMADFGKAYLAHDRSVVIYQCLASFQFRDPAVDQVSYECVDGVWTLSGKFSDCVSTGEQTGEMKFSRNFPLSTDFMIEGPSTTSASRTAYCPKPPGVDNGYLQTRSLVKIDNNNYDGSYRVLCYSGYNLVGDSTVQCVSGAWTRAPSCSRKASCSLDVINQPAMNVRILDTNLMYDDTGTGITVGSYVTYECLDGYEPEIDSSDLNLRCLPSGKWSGKTLTSMNQFLLRKY